MSDPERVSFWRGKAGIVLAGFLAIAGFFLITEQTAHVLGALPWLLLAACPLMHLFMHHGNNTHDHGAHSGMKRDDGTGSSGARR